MRHEFTSEAGVIGSCDARLPHRRATAVRRLGVAISAGRSITRGLIACSP